MSLFFCGLSPNSLEKHFWHTIYSGQTNGSKCLWINSWILILNLFLLRLLESPTLLTILHYVPTLGFMWHTLRTGFTCSSSRLKGCCLYKYLSVLSVCWYWWILSTIPPATGPFWFLCTETLGVSSASSTTATSDLTLYGGRPTLLGGSPQSKKKGKRKKNAPKTLVPKSVWFSRFTCWNKHDFILLVLLIEMSCLLLKLYTFSTLANQFSCCQKLQQMGFDGKWQPVGGALHISRKTCCHEGPWPRSSLNDLEFPRKRKLK